MQPSTKPRPVNKEAIRILVADVGYQEASQRTGVAANTLYQWARRFHWNTPIPHAQKTVRTVRAPADAHAEALQEMEQETRISLARSAQRMAKDCEELPVRHADKAYTVAKTMAIVHRQDQGSNGQSFTLNVLNLGSLGVQVRQPDAQGDPVGSE